MAKGFNKMPRPGGGGNPMMAQIQRLQQQMAEAQAKLAEETVSVTVGGGAITHPGRYLVLMPPINGATATSGTPYFTTNPGDHFFAWDYSVTLDFMPHKFSTWRIEYNHREASVPYFAGRGGVTPPGGNQGTPGSMVTGWAPDLSKTEDRAELVLMVRI